MLKKPVPNFTKDRAGNKPEVIVIHVGEGSQQVIYDTFLNEQKSSHYCVSATGEVWQFVEETDTAWGNGVVKNPTNQIVLSRPNVNPNLYTISIEHEGFGTSDFTDSQYSSTALLVRGICTRWGIPMDRIHIIRHNEIRVDKTCPGVANVDKLVDMVKSGTSPSKEELKKKIIDLVNQL